MLLTMGLFIHSCNYFITLCVNEVVYLLIGQVFLSIINQIFVFFNIF